MLATRQQTLDFTSNSFFGCGLRSMKIEGYARTSKRSAATCRQRFFASLSVRQLSFSTVSLRQAIQSIEMPLSLAVSRRTHKYVLPPTTARCWFVPTIRNCMPQTDANPHGDASSPSHFTAAWPGYFIAHEYTFREYCPTWRVGRDPMLHTLAFGHHESWIFRCVSSTGNPPPKLAGSAW